jgi:hypothetical protein
MMTENSLEVAAAEPHHTELAQVIHLGMFHANRCSDAEASDWLLGIYPGVAAIVNTSRKRLQYPLELELANQDAHPNYELDA